MMQRCQLEIRSKTIGSKKGKWIPKRRKGQMTMTMIKRKTNQQQRQQWQRPLWKTANKTEKARLACLCKEARLVQRFKERNWQRQRQEKEVDLVSVNCKRKCKVWFGCCTTSICFVWLLYHFNKFCLTLIKSRTFWLLQSLCWKSRGGDD